MKKLVLCIALINVPIVAKVLLITHNYNRPDFIELQHKTFKKFLHDDYEYVVFNDARDQNMTDQINQACTKLNIPCVRIPQEIHTRPYLPREPHDPLHRSNIRHANCIQYSLDVLGFDYGGIVCILDADMFLIRPFSIEKYMEDKDIAAFHKRTLKHVYCLCPVLCFLSMNTLPEKRTLNFNCGTIDGCPVDSGGFTYHYLIKHPELKVCSINALYSHQLFLGDTHIHRAPDTCIPVEVRIAFYTNLGFNTQEIQFLLKNPDTFEFYLDNNFLHYRDGSNDTKQSQEYHIRKFNLFNDFIANILQ